ncbi:unnamed protein product [Alopecurus aequalis]
MVDALGVVRLIVSLVIAIKGAVGRVKQNKEECHAIANRVSTLDTDLSSLDNTEATKRPPLSSALEGLNEALHHALQVVMDCEEESTISHHTNATRLSEKLRQANQNISDQIARVTFVASLQSNIVLISHHPHCGVRPLPQEESYSANSREEEGTSPITSCSKKLDRYELMVATKNFSDENVIGESASCTVYKGQLPDGPEVAVKSYRQYCLVYEYMHNQSLSAYINGDRRGKLPWTKRFNIIKGIARGALYLHDLCGLRIIHLHLKPSNILLDRSSIPKIGDFGISKTLPESTDKGVAASLMGTRGFQAPEYVREGIFSVKSDVYSYGVLLLELITGMNCGQEDEIFNPLTNLVWESWQQDRLDQCIDKRLLVDGLESQIEEIERCIHIALLCVEEDPALRLDMSDVLQMLNDKKLKLRWPRNPAFSLNYGC